MIDEQTGEMFHILPGQYYGHRKRTGVELLMMAVLRDALWLCRSHSQNTDPYTKKGRLRETQAALAWIADDRHWGPFAFVSICEHLGLSRQAIRRFLQPQGNT